MEINEAKAAHLAPYRWTKGQSGRHIPGRPPGVVSRIKRRTKGGNELIYRLLDIGRGETLGFMERVDDKGAVRKVPIVPSVRDRREALIWLLERLAGKPRQVVEVAEDQGPGFVIMLRNKLGSIDPMARTEPADSEEQPLPPPRRPALPQRRTSGGIGEIWDPPGEGDGQP